MHEYVQYYKYIHKFTYLDREERSTIPRVPVSPYIRIERNF